MDYKDAWDYQQNLFDEIVEIKKKNRKNNSELITPNYFLFVEHPHVYTLGKSGNMSNLLIDKNLMEIFIRQKKMLVFIKLIEVEILLIMALVK